MLTSIVFLLLIQSSRLKYSGMERSASIDLAPLKTFWFSIAV